MHMAMTCEHGYRQATPSHVFQDGGSDMPFRSHQQKTFTNQDIFQTH